MDKPTFDKSKLPSRHVSVGPERAPHRSYYYAMGLTEEEIGRPFVGIASAGNDSAPCNTTLNAQADVCRDGVNAGGGMPRRFNTITVTDAAGVRQAMSWRRSPLKSPVATIDHDGSALSAVTSRTLLPSIRASVVTPVAVRQRRSVRPSPSAS